MTNISANNNCDVKEGLLSPCLTTSTITQNQQEEQLDIATADLKLLDQKKESIELEKLSAEQQAKLFERTAIQSEGLSLYNYLLSHPRFNLDEALKNLVSTGAYGDDSYAAKRSKSISDLIDHGANPNQAFFWRLEDIKILVNKNLLHRLEGYKQTSLFYTLGDHPISDMHHRAIKQLDNSQKNDVLLCMLSQQSSTAIDLARLLFQEGAVLDEEVPISRSVSKEMFAFLKQEKFASFSPAIQTSVVLSALSNFELNDIPHIIEEYKPTSDQQSDALARTVTTNLKKAIELATVLLQINPHLNLNPALAQALNCSRDDNADVIIFLLNHGANITKCRLPLSEVVKTLLKQPISDVHTMLIGQLTPQQKEKAAWQVISSDAKTAVDFARMLFDNGVTLTKPMPIKNSVSKPMFDFLKQEKFSSFSKEVKDAITFHALPNLDVDDIESSGFDFNTIISNIHKKEAIEHLLQQGADCNFMQFNKHAVSKESFDFLWNNPYCKLNKLAKLDLILNQKHLSKNDAWELLKDFPIDLVLQQALRIRWSPFVEQALAHSANPNNIYLHPKHLGTHVDTLLKHSKHELTKTTQIKLARAASVNPPAELKKVIEDNTEDVMARGAVGLTAKTLYILQNAPKTPKLLDKLLGALNHGNDHDDFTLQKNAVIRDIIFSNYKFTCSTKQQYPDFQLPDGSLRLINKDGYALIHFLLQNFENDCVKQLLLEHPRFTVYENPNFEAPIRAALNANNTAGASLCWQFSYGALHYSNDCNAIKQLAVPLPNALQVQDIPYEELIIEEASKLVILIHGSNTHGMIPEYMTSLTNYILHHGISFAQIGDGRIPISLEAIEYRLEMLRNNIKKSVEIEIVFFAHGNMRTDTPSNSEYHVVQLGTPFAIKTSYVFDVWTKIFPHKNIPVSFISCHGGGASLDIEHLPGNHSNLLFFAMSHQSVYTVNFGEAFLFNNQTISDSILNRYLVGSIDGFITFPGIANTNGVEYSIDTCRNIAPLLTDANIQAVTRSICSKEHIKNQLPQYTTCENLVKIIVEDLPSLKIDVVKSPIFQGFKAREKPSDDICFFNDFVQPSYLESESYYNVGLTIFVCGELRALSEK